MLKNCFPWSQNHDQASQHLLQLPLSLSLPLKKFQTSFSSSGPCDPLKHHLQLREDYFVILDIAQEEVLSFCVCEPRISLLWKKMGSTIAELTVDQGNKQILQMMVRMAYSGGEHPEISLFFDLAGEKLIELYRIVGRTFTVQLDFHQHFRPIRKIGQGLTATVYQVNRNCDNATLAVKAFKKSIYFSSAKGKGEEAFKREFKFLTQCEHEGICRLEGVYETQNTIYIVQEYYEKSLGSILASREALKRKQVVAIMEDLLRAVHYLHAKGIFHRDIKLDNIMLRRQNNSYRPVLIDLGLAHHVNQEDYLFQKCGTPGYIAPEIFAEGAKDPKGDIFSLGVILHILLFKRPVFCGENREELIHNNRTGNMSLEIEKMGGEDELIKDLLLRMLEMDKNSRLTALQALQHPLFQQKEVPPTPETIPGGSLGMIEERINFQNTNEEDYV